MKLTSIAKVAAALSLALAPMATAAPGAMAGRIDQLDGQLDQITSTGEQLRSSKLLTARDFEISPDQSYASGMYNVMLETLNSAKLASDSKGSRGDVEGYKVAEDLAVRHEEKLAREVELNDQFMARIRTGEVLIDPKYVATWSPRERAAFKAFLSPSAAKSYSSLDGIMPAALPQAMATLSPADLACSAAAPCVTPCANKNWSACAACVANAIPAVRNAWTRFNSCWNGAGKPRWTPLWAWRIQCLAAFVRVLA